LDTRKKPMSEQRRVVTQAEIEAALATMAPAPAAVPPAPWDTIPEAISFDLETTTEPRARGAWASLAEAAQIMTPRRLWGGSALDAASPTPIPTYTPPVSSAATRRLKVRFARTETFEAEVSAPSTLEVEDLSGKELKALVFRHALMQTTPSVRLDDDAIEIHSVEILEEKEVSERARSFGRVFTLIREYNAENRGYHSPEVVGVYTTREAAKAARDRMALDDESESEGQTRIYYRRDHPDGEWDLDYTIAESEVEG
jgi:hypothetical protein